MAKSKRSEATLTARMNHEGDHGMNGDSNLSQTVYVHLNKENSQGTMTLTDNKEERLQKTKGLQCMMPHALASTTLTDFPSVSGHFTHIVGLFALHFVSPIQLLSLYQIYAISDLYENSLQRFTLRKWSCEVLSVHPRRLQQTAVCCKPSNCHKIREKNRGRRTSEVLSKDGKQRVSPFYHVALHVSSCVDFL